MRIETERLILRSIREGDEKALADMAKDGSFSELGFDSDCPKWIDEWIEEAVKLSDADYPGADYICNVICLKEDGRVIGSLGCTYYDDLDKIGICYGIGAEYRRHGYASEALQAYLEYFFGHYDEDELIATILDDNVASWKTIERSGFMLSDKGLYKDKYDAVERLYRFYTVKRK